LRTDQEKWRFLENFFWSPEARCIDSLLNNENVVGKSKLDKAT